MPDAEAITVPMMFPRWIEGVELKAQERVCYNNTLYVVLQDHTTQATWTPPDAPSLFARVLIPDETIPDWEQPDSTNAYKIGDKVRYNGIIWVSEVDNNVWMPGVYGWREVNE